MNETEARTVLLIQALETGAEAEGRLLTPAQSREASDVVRAGMPKPGRTLKSQEWSERFLVQRAQRLLQDAAARRPALRGFIESGGGFWPLVQALVVVAGFAAGFASDALVNPDRINLLSAPLLGVVLWNWGLALAWLLSRLFLRRRRAAPRAPGWMAASAAWPGRWRRGGFAVASRFSRAWAQAAAPLWQARVRAALHLGAVAVALGLIAYIGARALPHEFSVGWESQLIKTPEGVHRLLQILFWPVTLLPGVAGVAPFTLEEVTAMHHWAGTSPALADRWLQLVTALLLVSIVLPRLLLWLLQSRRARRHTRHFPLDLTDPYFARLLADGTSQRRRRVVWPYAATLDAARAAALQRQAPALLGVEAEVSAQPALAYGDAADTLARRPAPAEGEVLECAALLSLSGTPEAETHGAFLRRVAQLAPQALVLLDSGAFVARLGRGERLKERETLWTEFVRPYGFTRVHVVELGG